MEETKDSWIISVGEYPLELDIKEAKEENTQSGLNEEKDQEHHGYTETWFTTINKPH